MSNLGKRGFSDTADNIIFIAVTVAVMLALLGFAYVQVSGIGIYEQVYAKQIALLIDQAEPGTTITLHMDKAVEFAKKNDRQIDKIVIINGDSKQVEVGFRTRGSYYMPYISDYNIFVVKPLSQDGTFVFRVENKNA